MELYVYICHLSLAFPVIVPQPRFDGGNVLDWGRTGELAGSI